jgi:hypothetical protein
MGGPEELPSFDLDQRKVIHGAIGEAMEAYAEVEMTLASVLRLLLHTELLEAHAVFFAIQNVRSRNELFQTLLTIRFKDDIKKFWNSCDKFLLTLAQYRNAIAHWHPLVTIYLDKNDKATLKNAIGHPAIRSSYKPLEIDDFPPFIKDCLYIRQELSGLISLLKDSPATFPDKFRQPIARRNQGVLRPHRKTKAQQHPPQSSRGKAPAKQSAKQRRQRAFSKTKHAKE